MKWDTDKANGVMWIASEAAEALCYTMKKQTGIRFAEHICYIPKPNFIWCTLEKENEKVGNFLVKKFKNSKFAEKFVKDYNKLYKTAIPELNMLDKTNFSSISNKKLFKILKRATDVYILDFEFGFIIEPMDFVMPGFIESKLLKQGFTSSEIADMFSIADISLLNKEMQNLLKIKKEQKNKQKELLKKHAYNYRWLQSTHLGRKDIPLSFFEKRLNRLKKEDINKELEKLVNFKKNIEKRKKEIMAKKPVDSETKTLLDMANIIGPMHDMRKELFMRAVYTTDTARAEIAKRYGYTKEELSVFQCKDIVKLEQGKKLDKNYAREMAKEGLLFINTKKKIWKYYSGKKAREIFEKETAVDFGNIKEIRGMAASLGKARGNVKIIHGLIDMAKMKDGDIIVASMTKTEFVPAMKKAAAIITDEGGVTCHAAIISRELGVPCIIGTKIASMVLRDNDFVEVDADKGVVRILKRK